MRERPIVTNPFGLRPSSLAHGHECANGPDCPSATCRRGWVCSSMHCAGQHRRYSSIACMTAATVQPITPRPLERWMTPPWLPR